MIWLIAASAIWAFSFGLIKGMTPHSDPFLLAAIRLAIAGSLSLIFLRPSKLTTSNFRRFFFGGFIQLGLMYAPYMLSFRYLKAHEVALFTMTTPLFVAGIDQIRRRYISKRILAAAVLAVLGGAVVAWKSVESPNLLWGCLLVQFSNMLFAWGQLLLVQRSEDNKPSILHSAPVYFLGACVGSWSCLLLAGGFEISAVAQLSRQDWLVLTWLGAASTAAGFLMWNFGALRVSTGQLAVAADFKLPIAILISLIVFKESTDVIRLAISSVILAVAGWWVRQPERSDKVFHNSLKFEA